MIAKHEEEKRAVRKAEELEAERNAPSTPSHPCIPECPVGLHFSFKNMSQNNQFHCTFIDNLARCAWKRWPHQIESSSVGMDISSVKLASECQKLESISQTAQIFRNGLNPCICPKCRQEMIGRATDMENFLKLYSFSFHYKIRFLQLLLTDTLLFYVVRSLQ